MAISLITVSQNTDAKSRRISYITGRSMATAYKSGDISHDDCVEAGTTARNLATWADFLAGYRDGIDFYDVNRTGQSWDDLARLYYAAKGIMPTPATHGA